MTCLYKGMRGRPKKGQYMSDRVFPEIKLPVLPPGKVSLSFAMVNLVAVGFSCSE